MASTTEDMVSRIQAMADALVHVVPPETVAYGKGGSIDWQGFYCATRRRFLEQAGRCFESASQGWTGEEAQPWPVRSHLVRSSEAARQTRVVNSYPNDW
jgi:hypothetical protein